MHLYELWCINQSDKLLDQAQWECAVNQLLSTVPFLYRKLLLASDVEAPLHLPPSHIQVLLLLDECQTMTVSEIGRRLFISRPNMTPLLNKLINIQLVKRQYSEADRRVIHVFLTEQGKAFVKQYKACIGVNLEEEAGALSEMEQKQLADALHMLEMLVIKLQANKT